MFRLWRSKSSILLEEVAFLRVQVAQLQNYILMTGGTPAASFPTWTPPAQAPDGGPDVDIPQGALTEAARMYTTELEEDVEYQLQEGLIGEREAARLLKEANAVANDIELI